MKNKIKFILSTLALFSVSHLSAQHNDNQINFKNKLSNARFQEIEEKRDIQQENEDISGNFYFKQGQTIKLTKDEVILKCSALMNVKADSYLAIFNLTQVASSAKEADELINKRIQAFIESLKALNISSSDVHTDMIYLIPVFEYEVSRKLFSKTYNEVPKGFEMQKNLHIKFNDNRYIDKIVTLAAANEIYDLVTIEYFVKENKELFDSLRRVATNYIHANAKNFEKLGVKLLDNFSSLSERSEVVYPDTRYSNYESFVSQSLEAARNTTVTTLRKPKTVAYNKLSYDQFDIVIHPEFLEPAIQYVFNLYVRYKLPEKAKEQYMIIDPNGNLKPLDIKK